MATTEVNINYSFDGSQNSGHQNSSISDADIRDTPREMPGNIRPTQMMPTASIQEMPDFNANFRDVRNSLDVRKNRGLSKPEGGKLKK